MRAPMRLERHAPIGRYAVEQARRLERVDPYRILLVELERLVTGQFQIEHVVDHGVRADAAHMRCERAFDQRRSSRFAGKRRTGIGEGPGRGGVPDILHGRIIIGGDTVDEVETAQASGAGQAEIGIVPIPGVQELVGRIARKTGDGTRGVVGDLDEGTEIAGDRAAPEAADGRQHSVVVRVVGIGRRRNLRDLRVGIADDGHHRDRRHPTLLAGGSGRGRVSIAVDPAGIAAQLVIGVFRPRIVREQRRPVETAAHRIAEQLEAPAERRQPRKIGVAGSAGLPGLPRETRQRLRRRRVSDGQEAGQHDGEQRRREQAMASRIPDRTTASAPHRASPCRVRHGMPNALSKAAHENHNRARVARAVKPNVTTNLISIIARHFGNIGCICNNTAFSKTCVSLGAPARI